MKRPLHLAALVLAVLAFAAAPVAQEQAAISGAGSVFRYARPGQPVITVNVLGYVRLPGLYVIEEDTDLIDLLTLAGGAQVPPQSSEIEVTTRVTLTRRTEAGMEEVMNVPFNPLLSGEVAGIPDLREDDVLSVQFETKSRFGLQQGAVIVGALGTVALIIFRFTE